MTRLADLTVYWNGTAVNQTVGNVTRAMQGYVVVNPTPITATSEKLYESVELVTGAPVVGSTTGFFTVRGTTSTTTSLVAVEREIIDDWSLLGLRYNPFDGLVDLRVDRKDASAADVSRILRVRATELSTAPAHRGGVEHGIRLSDVYSSSTGTNKPHYYYMVQFEAPYGLWKKRVADDDAATATTGGATLTTTNDGVRDVPCRVTFGTVTGSPTTATISLSGTTYVTFESPATGQYFDFGMTTAGEYDGTATVTPGGLDLRIPDGSTAWTVQVTSGTGTVPMTISFYPEFNSW